MRKDKNVPKMSFRLLYSLKRQPRKTQTLSKCLKHLLPEFEHMVTFSMCLCVRVYVYFIIEQGHQYTCQSGYRVGCILFTSDIVLFSLFFYCCYWSCLSITTTTTVLCLLSPFYVFFYYNKSLEHPFTAYDSFRVVQVLSLVLARVPLRSVNARTAVQPVVPPGTTCLCCTSRNYMHMCLGDESMRVFLCL